MRKAETYVGQVEEAAAFLKSELGSPPRFSLTLGSGLSPEEEELSCLKGLDFERIPHFPAPRSPGHPGRLLLVRLGHVPVILQSGRVHLYEGYPPELVVLPQLVMARWGVEVFVLGNAAGGIDPQLSPGALMLLRDHLNLTGTNPLVGGLPGTGFPVYPDMTEAYSLRLRKMAHEAAAEKGITLREGVYAAVLGPSYETPSEIRMLRRGGADAVGMSTVPEVIALRSVKRLVLGLSCITNRAAGVEPGRLLSHREVLQQSRSCRSHIFAILKGVIARFENERESADGID